MFHLRTSAQTHYSRGLIIGAPNTGKTSFLSTIAEPTVVLAYPDEKGIRSIPVADHIQAYIFDSLPLVPEATVQEHYAASLDKYHNVLAVTRTILAQKDKPEVLFLDGLSKFYDLILDVVTKGKYLQGRPFDETGDYTTRLYGNAHTLFRNYLSEIYLSALPTIIATAWERLTYDDEASSDQQKRQDTRQGLRVWVPALPGQMGNLAAGEFDWCVRTGLTRGAECTQCQMIKKKGGKPLGDYHYTFQLQPWQHVQCVGIKGMKDHSIPTFIHQDWPMLRDFVARGA